MKKILGLLLTLFVLACSPSDHTYLIKDVQGHSVKVLPIYLDERFNADEAAAIMRGISAWNEALGGEMKLDVVNFHYKIGKDTPGLLIIKVSVKEKIARQEDTFTVLGWTTWKKERIFLVYDRMIVRDPVRELETPWTMTDMTEITMHEIAHAIGAEHIKYDGLMADQYSEANYACIDLPTISQVAKYQHLELSRMKWCNH